MPKTRPILLLAVAFAFPVAGCGDDDNEGETNAAATTVETGATTGAEAAPSAPSGEAVRSGKVAMADFAFQPATVTIQAGGKVTWRNEGARPHTATAEDGSFDTGTVDPGKLKSASFKAPGAFTYICQIHPQMMGTVEVVD
jgi:plastocyanin